ncbi:hypothetical protein CFD26_104679 [Aspergillus turcosus]|uniref:Uncharacterized protein n=1 Tax=Aspergillus turcosus TaxID=1245748 RepID=A0A421D190_9EURO|nr:hypothetical protein CFD26_104679 [Aspergillus turcosus]
MSTFSEFPREVPGGRSLSLRRLSGWLGTLILGYEPDERLLRAELISIVAAIITRLADPEYEDHSVVPVMVVSLLGQRKVRIPQAHNNDRRIVIRMSGFIRFKSPEEATENMDLLMRFMASNTVGDTADPKNFFGPETPPSIPGPSGVRSSQEELPEEIPENMSRLSLTMVRQKAVFGPEDPPTIASLRSEPDPERRLFTRFGRAGSTKDLTSKAGGPSPYY